MPWFKCEVTNAGPAEDGVTYIALRDVDGTFPARWFNAVDSRGKEMLAVALTALTTKGKVDAFITDTAEYSTLNRLYLNRV